MNAQRVISDLRELAARTSTPDGAQRLAWGPVWRDAREWFTGKITELGLRVSTDSAGNNWVTLAGASPKTVIVGSHLDSVPNGGWLDGCLGVMAALEAVRMHAGSTPIPMRRDAFLAAAQTALECREIAMRHSKPGAGVVCTVGVVNVEPKIVTAVPGMCEISLDQRALDPTVLAAMFAEAQEAS